MRELELASKFARQNVPTTNDELKVEDTTAADRLLIMRTDLLSANKGNDGLWLMNADGTKKKLLTLYHGARSGPLQRAALTNYTPGFARNDNQVAYSFNDKKSGQAGFLLARLDGQRLTNPKSFINISRTSGFVFSPDGNKVYFSPYEVNNLMEMGEKDLVSGKLSKLTNFNIERILSYNISRDGKRFYLVRGNVSNEIVLIRNEE